MNDDTGGLSHHPAPRRDAVESFALAFGLAGAPLAWIVQVCAGAVLSESTGPGVEIGIIGAALVVAAIACAVAWRSYRLSAGEVRGDHISLLELGAGRTRFMALWGLLLSAVFGLAVAANALAVCVLPRADG